ncbi:flagellar biosynthesis anti-sigma factor FlgM [Sodalis sp. C49]|uniref:flagellar biosynthesis anti-sigma factor FlgM n=1 Tax=unclassified Sodalis (in: enterobacteria) TaxID=2636512 RepID=UPI003965B734
MSIESTRPIRPLSTLPGNDQGTVQSPKAKAAAPAVTPGEETRVKLSDAQAQLRQPGSNDINVAKVESLKQAIRNGELKIDTGKIADALIAQTQSMLDE